MIFLMDDRAVDATKMGDIDWMTACFFSLIVFSSDFSRSICVLLSVRLPRLIDVFAAIVPLITLLHGDDCGCTMLHLMVGRMRFRHMMRGVIVVLSVQMVLFRMLPFRRSTSANELADDSSCDTFGRAHTRT